MRELPKPNEIYKHFKGNCYRIVTIATETETRQQLVVYQAMYGDFQVYARELSMFMSPVDVEKYPDATQKMRFEKVEEISLQPVVAEPVKTASAAVEPAKADSATKDIQKQESPQIDPLVMQYLDARTYADRLQILVALKDRITDDMINTMAMAIDVEIEDGDIEKRYQQLKYCIQTKERFECNRLR